MWLCGTGLCVYVFYGWLLLKLMLLVPCCRGAGTSLALFVSVGVLARALATCFQAAAVNFESTAVPNIMSNANCVTSFDFIFVRLYLLSASLVHLFSFPLFSAFCSRLLTIGWFAEWCL